MPCIVKAFKNAVTYRGGVPRGSHIRKGQGFGLEIPLLNIERLPPKSAQSPELTSTRRRSPAQLRQPDAFLFQEQKANISGCRPPKQPSSSIAPQLKPTAIQDASSKASRMTASGPRSVP